MHNLCTRFVTGELIIHRWSLILLALSLTLVSLPAVAYRAYMGNYGNRAKVVFSTLVSRSTPPGSTGFYIQYVPDSSPRLVGDYFQDAWATVRSGSSPSIYSDSTIDNVFAVTPLSVSSETEGLYFYPHADGSPDTSFTVHSDFRVMEDYICRKIGLVRGFLCGDINVMD